MTATALDDAYECPFCHEAIRVEGRDPAVRIIEVASSQIHECWTLDVDLDNLLVIDDPPPPKARP